MLEREGPWHSRQAEELCSAAWGYCGDELPIPALGFTETISLMVTHGHPRSGLPAVGAAGDRAVSSSGGPEALFDLSR